MILDEFSNIKINARNMMHYVNIGYNCRKGDTIRVKVYEISKGSHVPVRVQCDFCGKEYYKPYKAIANQRDKYFRDSCDKCKHNKASITNLERYGYEIPCLSPECKKKTSSKECIEKQKISRAKTLLSKYGVLNPMQIPSVAGKVSKTWEQKSEEEIGEICYKRQKTLNDKYGQKCSKQQIAIFEMVKELCPEKEIALNKPVNRTALDVSIVGGNIKIDIEYDGWYWHKDRQKDIRRDKFLQDRGWKIIRIRGGHSLPEKQQLESAIIKLTEQNKKFVEIVLPDWRD